MEKSRRYKAIKGKYTRISWEDFFSGVDSIFIIQPNEMKAKVPFVNKRASVSRSWKKIGNLITKSYVQEISALK